MKLLHKIRELFDIPVPHDVGDEYEQDYRKAAADLLRGQFDDLGEGIDLSNWTVGKQAAYNDFNKLAADLIKIGKEKRQKEIEANLDRTYGKDKKL